jgi:hypothetical protein
MVTRRASRAGDNARVQPTLALELSTTVLLIVAVVSVVLLVLIVVAPWRQVRDEPKMDPAVEAKLLLHRDPDEPTGEVPRVAALPDHTPGRESDADLSALAELTERDDD